jgi:hypothetical protein
MLKTVSSITNAIGALNYKGTWDASTNSPALASGVGAKGDYYVVSVAGSTTIDGQSLWGVGDWIAFNGTTWQRVEGGSTGEFTNISVNAGTVSAPSISKNGDSNTGIWFPANDTIAESVGGAQARTTTPGGNQILNGSALPYLFSDASALKGLAGTCASSSGKFLAGTISNVLSGATADFNVSFFAFGFLTILNVNSTSGATRTASNYSIFSRGGNSFQATQISTNDGSTSGASFTLSWVGDSTLRVTNDSAGTTDVTMVYMGI